MISKDINIKDDTGWYTLLDLVYPIGSIYCSTKSTSPASLMGGTWSAISGKFLLGTSSTYALGVTGGEATHTLTSSEIPSHNHTIYNDGGKAGWGDSGSTAGIVWNSRLNNFWNAYTGNREGWHTTTCLHTKQFLFGKELLNSYLIKFLMGTLFIKSTLFSIWSYSMNF